ncbi:MAG TPA: Mrp/NBP35 family ATP-binding protein [Polyangiales bacterium]|nr:Mrp/NBP35 family ATP-binding protein [Polyangiales bacterium]
MPELSLDSVQTALRDVVDPIYGKPMLALGLISDIALRDGGVSLQVTMHAVSEAKQRAIQSELERVLGQLGASRVDVRFKVEAPMRRTNADDPVPEARNVILVMSGKGGVGKSTCAANLALALHRQGARVGLLDADIYGPSVPTMLGVSGHPRSTDGKKIEPLERFGMKLMSIGFLIESNKDAIIWRGPMVQGALNQFLADVSWGELDYLVLDLPPGTGDVALSLAQRLKSTGAVIVTTPQEIALQDVYKSVSMCKKLNIPILGVIENMSFFVDPSGTRHDIFGTGGGQKIADFAEAPLLGQVPLDPQVRQWGDDGTPIVHAAPNHPSAQAFAQLAEALSVRIARDAFERAGEKAPDTEGPRRLKILR